MQRTHNVRRIVGTVRSAARIVVFATCFRDNRMAVFRALGL